MQNISASSNPSSVDLAKLKNTRRLVVYKL